MEPKESRETAEMEETDALCRECGHGFKVFVDRLMSKDVQESELGESITCPVCGCNECQVVHKGSS
jgi:Zn finger protein HypA/HybF involved in hydrogenase expression